MDAKEYLAYAKAGGANHNQLIDVTTNGFISLATGFTVYTLLLIGGILDKVPFKEVIIASLLIGILVTSLVYTILWVARPQDVKIDTNKADLIQLANVTPIRLNDKDTIADLKNWKKIQGNFDKYLGEQNDKKSIKSTSTNIRA